MAPNG
jgi:hypothetical protein